MFVFVRDGNKTIFADRWAGALMQREILWGPAALEQFATQLTETSADEMSYREQGVLVDYDAKQLMWSGDAGSGGVPTTKTAFQKLLQTAWPSFEIIICPEGVPVSQPTGLESDEDSFDEEEEDPFYGRCTAIADVAQFEGGTAVQVVDADDGFEGFEPDDTRAWLTLISKKQRVIHAHLMELPVDVLQPAASLGNTISKLKRATVPRESVVTEGIVIDMPAKMVSIWGGDTLLARRDQIDTGWKNWTVNWIDGYRGHCQAANVDGMFMSDAEAIAPMIPMLLSTKRFDPSALLGAMGGGIKKTAAKLTGCLYLLVCLPILIFATFSGQWIAALVTMLVTLIIFFVIFKSVERKVKKKMAPATEMATGAKGGPDQSTPPSAGPQDADERKATLDALLQKSGFPSLENVMQHCDPDDDLFSML